ncbi:unnamed protein product [Blepharisma stoltei]|uniref:nucleoside-diphosphate kinase n=1 Tax=Blepharisma stoltei TaxID=1481888 RepID=A0AAU9IEH2_9CILI|nr:unnamed protein product [Blepharisma stoltei]
MEQYSKPTRLIPLQLYSPFQNTTPFRRLISRDQERLRARSFKNLNVQSTKNQNCPEKIMSFARLYSQPALVFTTLHERQILGRVRKPKNLPPLSKTQYDSRFPKTTEANEIDRRAFSLELSRNSSQSDIIDAKWVGLETHKSEKVIEFLPDSDLIEEAAENQESELIVEKPENHDSVIKTIEKAEESGNFNFIEDKELEEDFKALKISNIETVEQDNKSEDFEINENQEKETDKGEEIVIPKLNLQIEHNRHDVEEATSPLLTPLSLPKIQIIEEHQEARTVAENSSLTFEAPGVILRLNSIIITVEGVDFELKIPLALCKHVMFGTELDIIVNITTSVFIGNNQLTFMKKENYLTNYAEISANNMQIIFQPDFQRSFLLLKPGAVKGKMIGKTIKRLELAGLVMKASKMIKPSKNIVQEFYKDLKDAENYEKLVEGLAEGPVVVMSWEGSNAIFVCRKIIQAIEDKLSPDSPLSGSFYSPENQKDTEKQLNLWFSNEERKNWDYHKNPRIIKTGQANRAWAIKLPTIEYITIGGSIIRPIPLGILRQMIDSHFDKWNEKWMTYFKAHEIEEKSPRAKRSGTDTSSLKANTVHNEKTVILSLNAPEVVMSNHELEAKYSFKIEDISSLLAIVDENGKDFLENIMIGCKLSSSEIRKKKVWKLKLAIDPLEFTGTKTHKLEAHVADIDIDGTIYNCEFYMPSVDVYDPETKHHNRIRLDSDTCQKLALENFDNWEKTCLDYFEKNNN